MAPLPDPDPAAGVFETMLVVDDTPIELARHLERLAASVDRLYGASLPDDAERLVRAGTRDMGLGRVRLDVRPGPTRLVLEPRAVPIDAAILFPAREHGAELRSSDIADWSGDHKWADRRLLDALDAAAAPATALLVDERDGAVLETTRANLFAVRADGIVVTPPADGRILPGVTRALAIELARGEGIDVVETTVGRADLESAAEIFTTGSVRGVEPVRSIDGRAVAGVDGGVASAIAAALRQRWLG